MAFDYSYVMPPTGQADNHIVREMFDDVKTYINDFIPVGGGAPANATYLTLSLNATLTNERVLTAGTGISFSDGGAGGTLTITNTGVTSITGTANQVIASGSTGAVTLSLPQSIATTSNVEFNRINLSDGTILLPAIYFDAVGSQNQEMGIWVKPLGSTTGAITFSQRDTDDNTTVEFLELSAGAADFKVLISSTGSITAATSIVGVTGVFSSAITLEETGAGTDTITLQAPSSIAASYTLTLPVDDGASGEVLSTNGSGVLSWVTASAGANTALSNLASVAINTTLVSDTNITDDLGTSSIKWRDLYIRGIVGTTTNDNAQTGSVGEIISSTVAGGTNFATSGTYTDATSISLTAGDWSITVMVHGSANTTTVGQFNAGITVNSGNTSAGLTVGVNNLYQVFTALNNSSVCIADYRVSLSGTTTHYLKLQGSWTGTTPNYGASIKAIRVR